MIVRGRDYIATYAAPYQPFSAVLDAFVVSLHRVVGR